MYRKTYLTTGACLVLLLSICVTKRTALGIAFSTNANGDWTADTGAGGTWTPDGGPNFFPISGDTAQFGNNNITVSTPQVFSGGGNSVGQNPFVTLNSTLTMDGGTFTYSAPGLSIMTGTGTWINQGIFDHTTNQTLYLDTTGGFTNSNAMNFTMNGPNSGSIQLRGSGVTFNNSGTLTSTATGANGALLFETNATTGATLVNTGTLRADGASALLRIDVPLDDNGGTISAINGGTIRFSKRTISAGHSTEPSTTYTTSGGGAIEIGGLVAQFQGSITGGSTVRIGEDIEPSQALSYIDFGSTEIGWGDAGSQLADVIFTSGRVLEFRSPVNYNSAAIQTISGDGTLRNVSGNTFTMSSSALLYLRGGSTFENNGTIVHSGTGNWQLDGAVAPGTATLVNNGAYQATAGSRTFNGAAATGQTFDNQGVLEVDATSGAATYSIHANTIIPQFSSNTLTGGTWRVNAVGANGATLNIDPANAGITTIGAGAVVELGETGAGVATIAELTGLANVNGELRINGTKVFSTTASGLAIGSTGIVGGTGTIAETLTFTGGTLSPGGSGGTLNVTGDVLLDSASTLDFELSTPDVVGGPNDLVEITGNLTLAGTLAVTELPGFGQGTYRLFNVTGSITDNGLVLPGSGYSLQILEGAGEVNLVYFIVPEPSSLVLCSLAGLVLLRKRRQGRQR